MSWTTGQGAWASQVMLCRLTNPMGHHPSGDVQAHDGQPIFADQDGAEMFIAKPKGTDSLRNSYIHTDVPPAEIPAVFGLG